MLFMRVKHAIYESEHVIYESKTCYLWEKSMLFMRMVSGKEGAEMLKNNRFWSHK